ncbi:MAG: FkbM family methyltransferase [Cyclobacteriaceae bacterium]|nr:FkbM family methyltransferase [Cyclobacteriaceae bacterium]
MNQVFGYKEYGPVLKLFKPEEPLTIVDAGANVGFASVFFKTAFLNSSILCLEIDDSNFMLLQKNIAMNGFSNVTTLKEALWKSNAFLEIKRDFRDKSECSYYVEESPSKTALIGHNLLHYRSVMNWQKIDLLKIDIEGAERYLFENPSLANQVLSNTRVLVIEIHDEFAIRKTIEGHLSRHSFTYFNHGDITIATRINN